ncbi:hypothetical protein M9H77_05429 [Catharanthus roseus]|uniref:Uncharacterized protein n=1 Tax=Catharanthus roseus TaxID=4058 RepID=A0ACC0CGW3_CATRO|nr:hypothetical protein M9H77_05429 [Catharanthus roseus]
MLNAFRLLRTPSPEITILSPGFIVGKRFRQTAAAGFLKSFDNKMAQEAHHNPNLELGDTMSSLGKEYAMRCEEEGFGGIYAKNHEKTPSKEDDNSEEDFSANAKAPSGSGKNEVRYEEKDGKQSKVAS